MALKLSGFKVTLETYNDISQVWWCVKPISEHLKLVILSFDDIELEQEISAGFSDKAIAKKFGLSVDKQFHPVL